MEENERDEEDEAFRCSWLEQMIEICLMKMINWASSGEMPNWWSWMFLANQLSVRLIGPRSERWLSDWTESSAKRYKPMKLSKGRTKVRFVIETGRNLSICRRMQMICDRTSVIWRPVEMSPNKIIMSWHEAAETIQLRRPKVVGMDRSGKNKRFVFVRLNDWPKRIRVVNWAAKWFRLISRDSKSAQLFACWSKAKRPFETFERVGRQPWLRWMSFFCLTIRMETKATKRQMQIYRLQKAARQIKSVNLVQHWHFVSRVGKRCVTLARFE